MRTRLTFIHGNNYNLEKWKKSSMKGAMTSSNIPRLPSSVMVMVGGQGRVELSQEVIIETFLC